MRKNAAFVLLGLSHRETADGIPVESGGEQSFERPVAQRLEHPPLDYSEQRVRLAFALQPGALAALGPAQRHQHRPLGLGRRGRIGRAFVEHHGDVRIERLLDAHGFLGREKARVAVDR